MAHRFTHAWLGLGGLAVLGCASTPLGAQPAVITGDPRVYGRVYVGTGGRGIVYGEPK